MFSSGCNEAQFPKVSTLPPFPQSLESFKTRKGGNTSDMQCLHLFSFFSPRGNSLYFSSHMARKCYLLPLGRYSSTQIAIYESLVTKLVYYNTGGLHRNTLRTESKRTPGTGTGTGFSPISIPVPGVHW